MLQTIKIRNFQAHRSLILKLDERITTIIGPSDRGKSAIIRALRWVCFNKPNGDAFVHEGEKFAKVQIEVDGVAITRSRGKGNKYVLDGQELHSFGVGKVPDLVARVLNLGEENFQQQHDTPFWFANTAGEVSRQLNAVIDLGVIDEALSRAQKQTRDATAVSQAIFNSLQDSKRELEELSFVPDMVEQFNRVRKAQDIYEATRQDCDALAVALEELKEHEEALAEATQERDGLQNVTKAFRQYEQTKRECKELSGLVDTLHYVHDALDRGRPDFRPIEEAHNKHEDTKRKASSLRSLVQSYKRNENTLCRQREKLKQTVARLPAVCPTCGQKTKPA